MTRPIIAASFQLFSNWCSMACAGCGIKTAPPPSNSDTFFLKDSYMLNARRNILKIKEKLDEHGYEYLMVEQSGGEPSHLPQIVELLGNIFRNCFHKIITNGLITDKLLQLLQPRKHKTILVISVDHHELKYNQLRLGNLIKVRPRRAQDIHNKVLKNLDLFLGHGFCVVVSSIISKYNMNHYLSFVEWLETRYPDAINSGRLVPIPVSLVSFGNPAVGRLNPSEDQIDMFEEQIRKSVLITVKRTRSWLFDQLIGLYKNKFRHFHNGESIDSILKASSKWNCDIPQHMISFNFQDEEIIKPSEEALYEGYACGVKVLGNIGNKLDVPVSERRRFEEFGRRPCNMNNGNKCFRISQTHKYLDLHSRIHDGTEELETECGAERFTTLRRGMCFLDDFDGVWWPFNVVIKGLVDAVEVGEFWSIFREAEVISHLNAIKQSLREKIRQDSLEKSGNTVAVS